MTCCLLPDGTVQGTCLRLGCNLCRACQGARPAWVSSQVRLLPGASYSGQISLSDDADPAFSFCMRPVPRMASA